MHINSDKKKFTVGIPEEFVNDLNDEVKNSFYESVKILENIGCKIKTINLKHTGLGVSAYQVVAPAECSSNLSRFDGVRYGHRSKESSSLETKPACLYYEESMPLFGIISPIWPELENVSHN